jgi:hypothetical protein
MFIEIKEIHPAPAGKTMAHVTAKDGQKFEIGPEKLAGIEIGKSYDVEVQNREWNGRTIRKITKVEPTVSQSCQSPSPSNGGGSSGEGEFAGHVVSALILKGEITMKQIASHTARLRQVWRETDPSAQQFSQAAE